MRVTQEFLRPGKYDVKGQPLEITRDYLREVVLNTNKAINAGYRIPFILEHAPVGTVGPVARDKWDRKANQLRNTEGWVKGLKLAGDGAAVWEIEVPDAAIAQKIQNGVLPHTSPELRPQWRDGLGNVYGPMVAHAAVTSTPRNPTQSPLTQFSLSAPIQFGLADMADEKEPEDMPVDAPVADEVAPEAEELAEEPADDLTPLMAEVVQGLNGLDVVVSVPEGADFKTFLEHLNTSLKTHQGMREKLEKAAPKDEPEAGDPNELKPGEEVPTSPMQYSLDDLENVPGSGTVKRLAKARVDHLKADHENLVKCGKITPHMRQMLDEKLGTAQFGVTGDDAGEPDVSYSHAEVLELFRANIEGQALDKSLLFSTEELPPDESEIVSPEQAKKIVDEQSKVIPSLRKK